MIVQENTANRYLETAKLPRRASFNQSRSSQRRAIVTLAEKGNKEGGPLIHQSSHDASPLILLLAPIDADLPGQEIIFHK